MPETAARKKLNSLKILAEFISEDFKSARLIPGITSGLVVGVVEVILAISFGALIYSGKLSGFVANGIQRGGGIDLINSDSDILTRNIQFFY